MLLATVQQMGVRRPLYFALADCQIFLQDRDSQKTQWIDRCVDELRNDTWVLPALKHIKEICMLFYEVST